MDDEDDYLSDKFLQQLASKAQSSSSKSYAERRKDAQRQAEIRNLAGRTKSRKELDEEAIETLKEGMNTSLFEKEKLAAAEGGVESKAMKMMHRMGFKPGQTLGRQEETTKLSSTEDTPGLKRAPKSTPITINLWEGRKGLGAMKRPLSPDSASSELERAAKLVKLNETASQEHYRSRNRLEYEERRDEGRLTSAQKTCAELDGKSGIKFNHLIVNLNLPQLIPLGIREQLEFDALDGVDDTYRSEPRKRRRKDNLERLNDDEVASESSLAARLHQDMWRDALVSSDRQTDLDEDEQQTRMNGSSRNQVKHIDDDEDSIPVTAEVIAQVREFLQQPVRERLHRVLNYMRGKYHFCFWCGAEYNTKEDMDVSCPGEEEQDHD